MQFMIPGMQFEKEEEPSDSDPETVEACRIRKAEKDRRNREEERRTEAAKREKEAWIERTKDEERFFLSLAPDGFRSDVLMKEIEATRPDTFEDRLKIAAELRSKGKELLLESKFEQAQKYQLCALHCLDFTPAQQTAQPVENRTRLLQAVAPVLQNLSLIASKMGDNGIALRAADAGLDCLSMLPYKDSKDLRIKMHLRRAMVRGDKRDFEGALEEARHVLQLAPGHENASLIERNCRIALRGEDGPEEHRWKGTLLRETRKMEAESWLPVPTKTAIFAVLAVVVAAVPFLCVRFA